MDTWLQVVWTFLRLSLFSLGGGNTLLRNITTSRWTLRLDHQPQFADIALAEAAPGPSSMIVGLLGWGRLGSRLGWGLLCGVSAEVAVLPSTW